MNQIRLWIAVLAVTSALAGLAAGVLTGLSLHPPQPSTRPFADYEARLVAQFDLDDEPIRVEALRAFLENYHRDVEELESRHMELIEPELERLGRTCRQLIRDRVLPPGRRAEFDRLASGTPTPAASAPAGGH